MTGSAEDRPALRVLVLVDLDESAVTTPARFATSPSAAERKLLRDVP